MRLAVLLALLCLLGLACGDLPGRPDPADRYQRPQDVEDFAELYAANCSGCHGEAGRLGPASPLGDPLYASLASPGYLARITAEGVKGTPMPPFAIKKGGTLTDRQVEIIAAGLAAGSLGGSPSDEFHDAPPLVDPSPNPASWDEPRAERGSLAYRAFCARCHGPGGAGGTEAGSIIDAAYLGLVSDQALRTAVIVGRKEFGMPGWRGAEQTSTAQPPMTQAEIRDVVAWIASHRQPKSR